MREGSIPSLLKGLDFVKEIYMGLFSKKKVTKSVAAVVPTEAPKCSHKYQDFPWYIEGTSNRDVYDRLYYTVKIIEPYVCIYCGARENKVLWNIQRYGSEKEGQDIVNELREKFKDHVRHRAEVEDMINDMNMVDVEHLKYYHLLAGTDDPSPSRPKVDTKNQLNLKL